MTTGNGQQVAHVNSSGAASAMVLTRAVQYVRMSTEHQRYSTENQSDANQKYADLHGMEIIRTYSDSGKSGLSLHGRTALQQLIREVESRKADFQAILVYDVSRWGRFQDADESAYYEFLCKRVKIQVHYCAEPFVNDSSVSSTLLKAIKRTMASEYSRELSVKVFAGKCRLIELGFRQGGHAGYGLRRLLQDQDGNRKFLLKAGEQKSILTDRVVLVPGPAEEIEVVREIYARYADDRQSCDTIADALNGRGLPSEHGGRWTRPIVFNILTNPKYIGANVSNRKSFKLCKTHVTNPAWMWVRRNNAFLPIISAEAFRKARDILAARRRQYTNDEMLELLGGLLKAVGYLSNSLLDRTRGMPSRQLYHHRFNGIVNAYKLLGYTPERDSSFVEINKGLQIRRRELLANLSADLMSVGATVSTDSEAELLTINDEFTISFVLVRCRELKNRGYRWQFCHNKSLSPDITIAARMDHSNESVLDYYLLPGLDFAGESIDLAEENSLFFDVYRFDTLSFLKDLARRSQLKEAT